MTANINPDTGIAYGYISANALDQDLVNELQMDGTDVYYADALEEEQQRLSQDEDVQREMCDDQNLVFEDQGEDELQERTLQYLQDTWSGSEWEQTFNDSYQPDEPVHEGTKDGVKYRTSWLGGALNVWIFESPYITDKAGRASPCVPNAGILDELDGDVRAYDVPPEWRRKED